MKNTNKRLKLIKVIAVDSKTMWLVRKMEAYPLVFMVDELIDQLQKIWVTRKIWELIGQELLAQILEQTLQLQVAKQTNIYWVKLV